MYKLKCAVQNYEWGKKGSDSLVAKIFLANGGFVDESKMYAEYWMGTHINGASFIELTEGSNMPLLKFLEEKFDLQDGLPFLFKVLSIKDPLSIQMHPDKQMAKYLHETESNHYKDPNHKPEMAIVLSENFEMFYGLLELYSAREILELLFSSFEACQSEVFLKSCENFITEKTEETYKIFLQELILLKENEYKAIIHRLNQSIDKYSNQTENTSIRIKLNLFKILNETFKDDKGLLFSLFMNYLQLKEGEFIFIDANVPHAYIKGDCAECMANSDNVIRLGLTPKFVDSKNFLKILENEFKVMTDNSLNKITPSFSENLITYSNPRYNDFKVVKVILSPGQESSIKIENFSIVFVNNGNCELINVSQFKSIQTSRYETIFIERNTEIKLVNIHEDNAILFIATF